jgi:SAM-dependent methyltransferase
VHLGRLRSFAKSVSEFAWADNLERLRMTGKRRGLDGNPSRSLLPLLDELPDDALIVDVGCGDSGDRTIAEQLGLIAFGVDLFPPFGKHLHEKFVRADGLAMPFATASIDGVVLHAVVSLVKPAKRPILYTEIARVLKPSGLLSLALYDLSDGWPVTVSAEDGRIISAGFHRKKSGRLYRRRPLIR